MKTFTGIFTNLCLVKISLPLNLRTFIFCLCLILAACDPPTDLGLNFIRNSTLTTRDTTFRLETSVIRLDSIQTTNLANLFFGVHEDFKFGKTTATSYLDLSVQSNSLNADSTYIYDSLVLTMRVSQIYGEKSSQEFEVYKIEKLETGKFYYDSDKINRSLSGPIATFRLNPELDSTYAIHFDDAIGLELFKLLTDNNTLTQDKLNEVLPALELSSSTAKTLIGINNASIELKLYYHSQNLASVPLSVSIFSSTHFNNLKSDLSGTPLAPLSTQSEIPVSQLDGLGYLKGGVGLALRIRLPDLANLVKTKGNISINQANLNLNISAENNFDISPPNLLYAGYADNSNLTQIRDNRFEFDSLVLIFSSNIAIQATYNSGSRTYSSLLIDTYARNLKQDNDPGIIIFPNYFGLPPSLTGAAGARNVISSSNLNQALIDISKSSKGSSLQVFYTELNQ